MDAGCGTGKLSRILYSQGFDMYGIDKSKESINIAKKYNKKIKYVVGDITKLSKYYPIRYFDIITSTFTTLYLSRTQFQKFIQESYKILKKNGLLLIADVHPFLPIIQPKTRWEKWISKKINYFEDQVVEQEIFFPKDNSGRKRKTLRVRWYHHSLNLYLNLPIGLGYKLIEFYEPKPSKNILNNYPLMWGEEKNVPVYFIIVLEKQ